MDHVRFAFPLAVLTAAAAFAQTAPPERALRFADDTQASAPFTRPSQWRTRGEEPASLGPAEAEGDGSLTLIFRAAKHRSYEAVNDLGDERSPFAINRIILAPADGRLGDALTATRLSGKPLALKTSPAGQGPSITLGARDPKREQVSMEVALDLLLENDLLIAGDGNQAFTLSGTIRESKAGVSLAKEGAATVLIAGNNNMWTGATTVSAGTLKIADGGSLGTGPLQIKSGATFAFADATVQAGQSSSIEIEERGTLDLHRGAWVIDYADATPFDLVQTAMRDGRIRSTALSDRQVVACVEASTLDVTSYAGRELDKTALVVAVVRVGDTNFDSQVNRIDLERLVAKYKKPGAWSDGEVTGDGKIDFDDLLKLMQNYDAEANFESDLRELNM